MLSLPGVERYVLVIGDAAFGKSQADTISIAGAIEAVKSESGHFRYVLELRYKSLRRLQEH